MVVQSLSLIDEGYLDLLKFKEISLCLLSLLSIMPQPISLRRLLTSMDFVLIVQESE